MLSFIQLPQAPLALHDDAVYRAGFRSWAEKRGNPEVDEVIIFALNGEERDALSDLWVGWPNAQVRIASPEAEGKLQADAVCFQARTCQGLTSSRTRFEALRCSPSSALTQDLIPVVDLLNLLVNKQQMGMSVALCADLREVRQRRDVLTSLSCIDEMLTVVADVPVAAVKQLAGAYRRASLLPAGRPFGQAGYSRVFMRPNSLRRTTSGLAAQGRVVAGHIVAQVAAARRARARARGLGSIAEESDSTLNAEPVNGVTQVPRAEVEMIIEQVMDRPTGTWEVAVNFDEKPDRIADDCYSQYGIWPISFSHPSPIPLGVPESQLSPIIPGFPYSFHDNEHYLSTYARSAMAITHRKAGWDCFRHVEIMASGAVPLMPDASDIPHFSMVHYPKKALGLVAEKALSRGGSPGPTTREAFRRYFEKHLTSLAMMEYVLRVVNMRGVGSALFVDEQAPVNPEYQSTLALIGLKQILGPRCHVAFPADFLYRDSPMSAARFYGRGFGYSHSLEGSSRSMSERQEIVGFGLEELGRFDAVIVGSVSRNADLTAQVLRSVEPSRVILIHGEDTPPTNRDYERLVASGAHVFVRSIYR